MEATEGRAENPVSVPSDEACRGDPSERLLLGQRPEGAMQVSDLITRKKTTPGKETSKSKGPGVRTSLESFKKSKDQCS